MTPGETLGTQHDKTMVFAVRWRTACSLGQGVAGRLLQLLSMLVDTVLCVCVCVRVCVCVLEEPNLPVAVPGIESARVCSLSGVRGDLNVPTVATPEHCRYRLLVPVAMSCMIHYTICVRSAIHYGHSAAPGKAAWPRSSVHTMKRG